MTTLKRNENASESTHLTVDAVMPQTQTQGLSLKFEEIQKLVSLISREHIDELQLESSDFKLHIRKNTNAQIVSTPANVMIQAAPVALPMQAISDQATADQPNDLGTHYVTSPIVGTFYRAASANAAAFVRPGDSVKPGQTLCIVEAMKLMNEIECDTSGELVAVLVDDGQPVEYGERLFSIRVC